LKRRKFIQQAGLSALVSQLPQTSCLAIDNKNVNWKTVAEQFRHKKSNINFNSGSSGVLSKHTMEILQKNTLALTSISPYKMFEKWQPGIVKIKQQLAESLKVDVGELAILRNTTEAINIVFSGYNISGNSEILFSKYDYPFVKNSIQNLSKQKDFKYKELDFSIEQLSDEEIIQQYKSAITDKTKLLVLTHITHAIGRILPVKAIIEIAHKNNVEVLLDAAHSYAHINYSIADLGCDYYATSLHKWLNAPYGNGLLFIKKEKIKKIQHPVNAYGYSSDNISKFEQLGTRAFQNIISIQPALEFHQKLTTKVKQQRLLELSNYFIDVLEAANIKNLQVVTDRNLMKFCGIVTFKIEDSSSKEIVNELYSKNGIIAKSVGLSKGSGIRISSNIFILKKDIDYLVEAISTISKTI